MCVCACPCRPPGQSPVCVLVTDAGDMQHDLCLAIRCVCVCVSVRVCVCVRTNARTIYQRMCQRIYLSSQRARALTIHTKQHKYLLLRVCHVRLQVAASGA